MGAKLLNESVNYYAHFKRCTTGVSGEFIDYAPQ